MKGQEIERASMSDLLRLVTFSFVALDRHTPTSPPAVLHVLLTQGGLQRMYRIVTGYTVKSVKDVKIIIVDFLELSIEFGTLQSFDSSQSGKEKYMNGSLCLKGLLTLTESLVQGSKII